MLKSPNGQIFFKIFIANVMTLKDFILDPCPGRWAAARVLCKSGSNTFSIKKSYAEG